MKFFFCFFSIYLFFFFCFWFYFSFYISDKNFWLIKCNRSLIFFRLLSFFYKNWIFLILFSKKNIIKRTRLQFQGEYINIFLWCIRNLIEIIWMFWNKNMKIKALNILCKNFFLIHLVIKNIKHILFSLIYTRN